MNKIYGLKIFRREIGVLLLIFLTVCCQTAPKPNESKIEEIKRVRQTVPVYPGMTKSSENDVPAESTLVITETYKSDANFTDVETFYSQRLIPAGWRLLEDEEIKDRGRIRGEQLQGFTKDNYRLLIQFAGERKAELGWDYAVELSPADYWKDKID